MLLLFYCLVFRWMVHVLLHLIQFVWSLGLFNFWRELDEVLVFNFLVRTLVWKFWLLIIFFPSCVDILRPFISVFKNVLLQSFFAVIVASENIFDRLTAIKAGYLQADLTYSALPTGLVWDHLDISINNLSANWISALWPWYWGLCCLAHRCAINFQIRRDHRHIISDWLPLQSIGKVIYPDYVSRTILCAIPISLVLESWLRTAFPRWRFPL